MIVALVTKYQVNSPILMMNIWQALWQIWYFPEMFKFLKYKQWEVDQYSNKQTNTKQ